MALTATSVADLLVTSLTKFKKLKFTDLMSAYQNTIALKRIFKKNKATIEDGPNVQFQAMIDYNRAAARHVTANYTTAPNIPNVMTYGRMEWRFTHWEWAVERRLIQMNAGNSKIVDLAQTQRIAALGGAVLLFERTLWRCPNATTEADTDPVGLPYFIVKSATAASDANNDGFNGGNPSGYTAGAAGISSTAYPYWRNYTDAYTDVSKPDLIRKLRRCFFKIDFMPLVDGTPVYEVGHDYGIYTTYDVSRQFEELLEAQNENLGNDVASKDGLAMIRRTSITPVKQLDADTTGPVYVVDWQSIGAMGLKNEWMNEQHFASNPNQPTISMTVTDCAWNMFCTNRRKNAVLSTGTTMPD